MVLINYIELIYSRSHIYSTYFPIMQDSPQTPADITNSNSIPASLGDACNKTLRRWRDKWVSKVEELQQQESRGSQIAITLS